MIGNDSRLAIIGGGVAGMTAAAAAALHGCKVTLFEEKPELFHLLKNNSKRYIRHFSFNTTATYTKVKPFSS